MRILAIDVGAGTQDILLYDSRRKEENNLKIILPSPVQILATKIRKCKKKNILVKGITMGGGPFAYALLEKIKEGKRIFITEKAARSIRDELSEVKNLGFRIIRDDEAEEIEKKNSELCIVETKDIDFDYIFDFLKKIEEDDFDYIGIAVQDHGFEKGKSDRITRFSKIKEILEKENSLVPFLFSSPPQIFTRMRANYEHAIEKLEEKKMDAKVFIVDTKIAAIAGAMHGVNEKPCMVFDIGNAHTMCAIVKNFSLAGIFEHHTALLNKEKIERFAEKLALGILRNEEIYRDEGHGAYVIESAGGLANIKKILVTGPKRELIEGTSLNFSYAMPFGDIMLSGAVGIVDLIKEKCQE